MIHLHLHTQYSVQTALGSSEAYAQLAGAGSTLAITDLDTMAGILRHEDACKKHGVTPIFGVDLNVGGAGSLVLLAETQQGLLNLYALSRFMPGRVTYNLLEQHSEGLIALTGHLSGAIPASLLKGDEAGLRFHFERLHAIYGANLFLETVDWGIRQEREVNKLLARLARRSGLELVRTNDVYYPTKEDARWHGFLNCERLGRRTDYHAVLAHGIGGGFLCELPDDPVAAEIARRCAGVKVPRFDPILPRFSDDDTALLRKSAQQGLLRLHNGAPPAHYVERLQYELSVIERMRYEGYFLIVSDFVGWAKRNGIPVGPARGSGGGCLVAQAVEIIGLDPIFFNLYFERFLNPDRVSLPDFDIDFGQARREDVIHYVKDRYGHDRVTSIATYGEYKGKSAFKAACRVLSVDAQTANDVTKRYMRDDEMTLVELVEKGVLEGVVRHSEELEHAITVACKLEGRAFQSVGRHAAGMIIFDRPAHEVMPVNMYGDTVFDLKDSEKAGGVKYDFLGLKELDVIDLTNASLDYALDLEHLPYNDERAMEVLRSGHHTGLFQVAGGGMSAYVTDIAPDTMEDTNVAISLYRPGPMDAGVGMHMAYLRRRRGQEPVTFLHDDLIPVLGDTLGIIVYQEQVLKIGQVIAGLTLGQADLLRRAIGKKDAMLLAQQRQIFLEGGAQRGYSVELCNELWQQIVTFARYGFNRSHAAGYGLICYQTAWLKAYYPAEFMAAQCRVRGDDHEELRDFLREIQRMQLKVQWPDVNVSPVRFTGSEGTVYFGLSALRGIGEELATRIVSNAPYKSLDQFYELITPSSDVVEALAYSGALDSLLGIKSPAQALVAYPTLLARHKALTNISAKSAHQPLLLLSDPAFDVTRGKLAPAITEWDFWMKRHHYAAHWTTGHPLDAWADKIGMLNKINIQSVHHFMRSTVRVAVVIREVIFWDSADRDGVYHSHAKLIIEDYTGEMVVRWFRVKGGPDAIPQRGPAYITLDVEEWDGRLSCKVRALEPVL